MSFKLSLFCVLCYILGVYLLNQDWKFIVGLWLIMLGNNLEQGARK